MGVIDTDQQRARWLLRTHNMAGIRKFLDNHRSEVTDEKYQSLRVALDAEYEKQKSMSELEINSQHNADK